ncbi:MAG: acyclic terpene utilization AtuA family protein, partial [Armatimonadetes bacterium]|nr:acyclic terpene utilization AtuA family protein [Armatimonadota bacterium]
LGYGFPQESFERGMAASPHVIAVDGGSTDPGPAYLGAGTSFVDRDSVHRDLTLIIPAGLRSGIPVIIGTAGGSGAKPHVEWCLNIIADVLDREGREARVAVIWADVSKERLAEGLRIGQVKPLEFVPELTPEAIDSSSHIVAQFGVEPIISALAEPVDIVVAGRCYDPAAFAALPIREGFDHGLALHLGKILECGAIAATPGSGRDCLLGRLHKDSFVVETLNPERRLTEASVAAHTLYEKPHPYLLSGPGGQLDLSESRYRQTSPSSVEVTGSCFVPEEKNSVKVEGARQVGYRTIAICGVRDPVTIKNLDTLYDGVRAAVGDNFGDRSFHLHFRTYGKDGVMGCLEPEASVTGHEVGIVFDVVAPTQKEADTICGFARSTALHYGFPGRITTAGNLAFPFSPSDLSVGQVYEFSVYHLLEVDDPTALFSVQRMTLGSAT